jgi:hypothetical protein
MGTPPVTCRVSELGGLSAISPALGPFLCPTGQTRAARRAVAPCKHVTNSNLGDGVDSNEADAINRALTNLHQLAYRSDGTGVGPSRQSQEKAVRRHARTAFFLRALNPGTGHQLGQPCAVGASPAYANPQSTFGSKLFPKSLAIAAPAIPKSNPQEPAR